MKISGIYKIINKVNNKCYIGASNNIYHRWYVHKYELNSKTHDNIHLQRAWGKYGEKNFEFQIIENVCENILAQKEQEYLNICKSNPILYYNLVYEAGGFLDRKGKNNGFYGKHHTEKTKRKISKIHKGKKLTNEQKLKISKNNARFMLGKHHSTETKLKMRKSKIGKKMSENSKKKLSKTLLWGQV